MNLTLADKLVLTVALAVTIPLIRWCQAGMVSGVLPRRWSLGLVTLPLAHAIGTFVVLGTILLSLFFVIVEVELRRVLSLLWPLAIVLPLHACLIVFLRWVTSSHRAKSAQVVHSAGPLSSEQR